MGIVQRPRGNIAVYFDISDWKPTITAYNEFGNPIDLD